MDETIEKTSADIVSLLTASGLDPADCYIASLRTAASYIAHAHNDWEEIAELAPKLLMAYAALHHFKNFGQDQIVESEDAK
jgi:hypothetical protein